MYSLLLLVSTASSVTLSSSSRMEKAVVDSSVESRPVFTRLNRFDVASWTEPHSLPLKLQASALAKLPGTIVSHRQMLALMGQANATSHEAETWHGFGVAEDLGKLQPREVLRLEDLDGTEYAGEIEVGTASGAPQAKLRVIFDTGSTDLWVLSDLCQKPPCTGKGRHVFNHTRSETFAAPSEPVEISSLYGSGALTGVLGFDTVKMGPLGVQKQMMGLISKEAGNTFEEVPFDGLVGLGFPSLGFQAHGKGPFVDSLMQQGSLPVPCFGFYLHRDPNRGGAVLWGGVDDRLYQGQLRWFPVDEEAYWSLNIVSFRIGGQSFNFKKAKNYRKDRFMQQADPQMRKPRLVVDSGTTLFTIPSYMQPAMHMEIGLGPKQCSRLAGLPPLVFGITDENGEKQEVVVNAEEYMVRTIFNDVCLPAVVTMDMDDIDNRPLMIIGEVFMRHFFTVFSRGIDGGKSRVGFARSKEDAEVEAFFADSKVSDESM